MRNIILITLIWLFISTSVYSQKNEAYTQLIKEGYALYKAKKHKSSYKKYAAAIRLYDKDVNDLYDASCAAALAKKKKAAIMLLRKSVEYGWNDVVHLKGDSDFYNIHSRAEWTEIIESVNKKRKQTFTNFEFVNNISDLLESENYEGIWEFGDENLLSKMEKQEFLEIVTEINGLLKENGIKKLNSLRSATSTTASTVNGISKKGYTVNYSLIPNFFGSITEDLRMPRAMGYNIKIELQEYNKKWKLSSILYSHNYFEPDYVFQREVEAFLEANGNMYFHATIVTNEKNLIGQGQIDEKEFDLEITKELVYIPINNYKIGSDSVAIISLSLYKKNASIFRDKNKKINQLQFVFADDGTKIVLLSNGYEYAFYKMRYFEKIRNLIRDEMLTIDE